MQKHLIMSFLMLSLLVLINCSPEEKDLPGILVNEPDTISFYFGADLSYVNQILDFGGEYKDGGEVRNPYRIFSDRGSNLSRFRLWHNPTWTKTIYGAQGTQLYNDIYDVEKAIKISKENGMEVLLDFHYSDNWADPGQQRIPAAWTQISNINDLVDSVYNYTFKTLSYLNNKELMPELVQIGNEINPGMLLTGGTTSFPSCSAYDGQWANLGKVINAGIQAVRAVSANSEIKTKIALHVADPKNVVWWFDKITSSGGVSDFDIVGFSYYPIWHDEISVSALENTVAGFVSKYGREVMILETAYPWTVQGIDNYPNQFGNATPFAGFPFSSIGQLDMMKAITTALVDGGGSGIIYWEPAWISSDMHDQWGVGSTWENVTLFDFNGNVLKGMDFMTADYGLND